MKTALICSIAVCCAAALSANAGTRVGIGISFGAPAPIIVHRAPPARVVERVVVAPGPGYVWVPGHYSWAGDRWVWLAGAWMLPPRPDARWVDGNWNPQTHQWIEAHWELPPPPPPPVAVVASPAPTVGQVTEVVMAEPPPAPLAEVRTVAPGPDFIWVSGYWGWENSHRLWFGGHWERPPVGYRVWVAPRWEHRSHGYVFVRGYWR